MNIPPGGLTNLIHAPETGISPGVATIIAAAFALAAAGLAYYGVIRQIRNTGQQAQRDRDAEAQRLRRTEQNQLLTQAVRHMEVMAAVFGTALVGDEGADRNFETAEHEARITAELLRVVGLTKSAEALHTFTSGVSDAYDNDRQRTGLKTITDTVDVFCAELSGQDPTLGREPETPPNRITRLIQAWRRPTL